MFKQRQRENRRTLRRQSAHVLAAALVLVGSWAAVAFGQGGSQMPPDKTVDAGLQEEIIDSVAYALNEIYVFPETASAMEKHMREAFQRGDYTELTSLREFASRLSEDLQEISHDGHLHVTFASDEFIARYRGDTITADAAAAQLEQRRRENFAFRELKVMPGNVGYVDLRGFSEATEAGATAIAAMNFLAYTDAIIFDLRNNGGGSPSMIQLLTSYFMSEPTHLNSFYVRAEDSIQQFWTQAYVPGPRMTDTKLYVLTSNRTFSGAEEFTYNMKNLKRGTIIGETTGGGAHPVDLRLFANLNVRMSLPFGRAVNPISGTNWEGTGVEPDIKVPQEEALDVAYLKALKDLAAEEDDSDIKGELEWYIAGLEAQASPFEVKASQLQAFAGTYGPRRVWVDEGVLYYQRGENPEFRLVPMSKDTFMLEGLDYFRIQFVRDDGGEVVKLVGMYSDGTRDSHMRDGK